MSRERLPDTVPPPAARPRVGVVGCGDIAQRRYLPELALLADSIELVACCDERPDVAARSADLARAWSPRVAAYSDLPRMLDGARPDAVINLTPAPVHAAVSAPCLEAGVHVYSEKPIALTLADADRLIAIAGRRRVLLLCAPGEAVTARVAWLKQIADSGRLGRLTLAVAHHADPGPAAWREYTGDPTVFYGPGVGPVFDHGIYQLHTLTALLGPVRRLQAMAAIGNPERLIRGGPLTGRTISVTAPDHVLINLEFANGALGQLLGSFGAAATQAPWLELHFVRGTISFRGPSWEPLTSASIYFDDDGPLGLEGWVHGLRPPPPAQSVGPVEAGIRHFVECLRGAQPVLTAEHARHVLDVILKAYESAADGRSHETETGI